VERKREGVAGINSKVWVVKSEWNSILYVG